MVLLSKFLRSVRDEGLIKSVRQIYEYLSFLLKIKLTKLKLNFHKMIVEPPIIIKHGNYKLYFNADGDYEEILYHAHWKKYFREEAEKIKSYVKEGDSVMDIGANLGIFTIILSNLTGSSGRVYSFEPGAYMFSKLTANIKLNNLNNVKSFELGMGETENELNMFLNPKQSGLSSIVERVSENCIKQNIRITTLDKFTQDIKERISFIKIDTEGYEPNVLKGGGYLIEQDNPVIYLELGGHFQKSSISALTLLKKLNYNCEAYDLDLNKVPPGTNFIALPGDYAQ